MLLFSNLTFTQTVKIEKYSLTIEKSQIKIDNKNSFLIVPTSLKNNSNDTLKFYSMSCSWQLFYLVDNKNLKIELVGCDKNIPIILTLNPGQIRTIEIKLLINQKIDKGTEIKFRIGFNLLRKLDNQKMFDFKDVLNKKNVIWSNMITM